MFLTFWPAVLQPLSDFEQVINQLGKPIITRSRDNLAQQPDNLERNKSRSDKLTAIKQAELSAKSGLPELPPDQQSKARGQS